MTRATTIPKNFPVKPLKPGQTAKDKATCGTCGRSWDDGKVTSMTPAPGARCPFEEFHADPKPKAKRKPKLVGIWVMAALRGKNLPELTKWGLDGDTEFPYPPDQEAEAVAQAKYVRDQAHGRIYILHVFDNGQMKQYEYTGDE